MVFLALAETIQLLPDGSLLIHVAMVLVMIWILNRTFFRPINKVIETRLKSKGGHSTEAEKILEEASGKNAEFKAALKETRTEGYELIEKERTEAMSQKQAEVDRARKEISDMLDKERAVLQKQIGEAKDTISVEAGKMADEISKNILKVA